MPHIAALFIALTLIATGPADAQFGGLLTKASFTKVLRILNAELVDANRRGALLTEADNAETRSRMLLAQHGADHSTFYKQTNANEECHRAEEKKIQDRHLPELNKRKLTSGVDMTLMAIVMRRDEAVQKADEAHDKAAKNKAVAAYEHEQLVWATGATEAEIIAMEKQCPPPPAWLGEADALTKHADSLKVQGRISGPEIDEAVAASGMDSKQYRWAKERISLWCGEAFDNEAKSQVFSDAERKMFEAHKAEIKRVRNVLAWL